MLSDGWSLVWEREDVDQHLDGLNLHLSGADRMRITSRRNLSGTGSRLTSINPYFFKNNGHTNVLKQKRKHFFKYGRAILCHTECFFSPFVCASEKILFLFNNH